MPLSILTCFLKLGLFSRADKENCYRICRRKTRALKAVLGPEWVWAAEMTTGLASLVPLIAWLLDLKKHWTGKEKVDQGARPSFGGIVRGDIVRS